MGIASLVLSILSGLGSFALVVTAGVLAETQPEMMEDEGPVIMLIGFGIMATGALALVSLILGIISLTQKDRRKICGILGTIFSVLVGLGIGGLMVIGVMMG